MNFYTPNRRMFLDYLNFIRTMDHQEGDKYIILDRVFNIALFMNARTGKRQRYIEDRFILCKRKTHLPKWW